MPEFPLVPERCALVVNDMEEKMVDPSSPYYVSTAVEALDYLVPLVDHCRKLGIPTLFALIGTESTREKGELRIDMLEGSVEDPSLSRLADRLGSHPNDFTFVKPGGISGCIKGTPVVDYVRERGRDTLLVTGITLQFGCDTTIRDACSFGFRVVAVSDGCVARPISDQGWGVVELDEVRKIFFSTWQKAFARVMTASQVIQALS